jgi:hypothetical protein
MKVGKVTGTLRNMSLSDSAMSAILLPHQENVLNVIHNDLIWVLTGNDLHSNINMLNFSNKAKIITPL